MGNNMWNNVLWYVKHVVHKNTAIEVDLYELSYKMLSEMGKKFPFVLNRCRGGEKIKPSA